MKEEYIPFMLAKPLRNLIFTTHNSHFLTGSSNEMFYFPYAPSSLLYAPCPSRPFEIAATISLPFDCCAIRGCLTLYTHRAFPAPSKLLPLEIVTAIYSSSAIALVSFAKATATEHEGGRYQIGRCQNPDARFILAVSYS
jgi:hypothetical protein